MSGMIYTLENEEELSKMKERTTKIKVILLDKMGKHPLTNPRYLKDREKRDLLLKMKDYLDNKTDLEIDAEFNEVCMDKLFENGTDISSYPIYDLSKKEEVEPETESVVDIAGNSVEIPKSFPENIVINGIFEVEKGANAGIYHNQNFPSSIAVDP